MSGYSGISGYSGGALTGLNANQIVVATSTTAVSSYANLATDSFGNLSASSITLNSPVLNVAIQGDALFQAVSAFALSYLLGLQNTSTAVSASTDFIVFNDKGLLNWANVGVNNSNYTGTGSWYLPSAGYFGVMGGEMAIGTLTKNGIHFFVNNGTTDIGYFDSVGDFFTGAHVVTATFNSTGTYIDGVVTEYTTGLGKISVGMNDILSFHTNFVGATGVGSPLLQIGLTGMTVPTEASQSLIGTDSQGVIKSGVGFLEAYSKLNRLF